MRFKIKDIGDEGLAVDLPVTAAWLAAEVPNLGAEPEGGSLRLRGMLLPSGDDYLLRASVTGALLTACARCLEPARLPLEASIAQVYGRNAAEGDANASLDGGDEGDGIEPVSGEELDVGPRVRDEIVLALPPAPLCREDCLGLCPVCGGNRNETPCSCVVEEKKKASPFAALANVKNLKQR